MKKYGEKARALLTATVIALAAFFWVKSYFHSPLWLPQKNEEQEYLKKYVANNSPDYLQEKLLAQAYWLRYKDIKENKYWGENGPQNIWGPRNHYLQHGRKEGRTFAPIVQPDDLEQESHLAQAYWLRYPEVAKSPVWGKESQLGILGPRDHYIHWGRRQGKTWGIEPQ